MAEPEGTRIKPVCLPPSELRILIVDDIDVMARLLAGQLRAAGYRRLTIFNDAASALAAMEAETFDILLTDWMMAPMGGAELCRALRNPDRSPAPGIAIIACSGGINREVLAEMMQSGVDEIVAKPVAIDGLLLRIKAVIDHPRQFVRVAGYFGPDRRRRYAVNGLVTERRSGEALLEERPGNLFRPPSS